QYMVIDRCEPAIEDVRFRGIDSAEPTDSVLEAIATADAVVIGPSNPVISINPILSVPGMRAAITDANLPVIAVSPFVGGEILKGPTAKFMQAAGFTADVSGVADYYGELADVLVTDQQPRSTPPNMTVKLTSVAMPDRTGQRELAEAVVATARRAARKH
ncbi:MAG: YvcK family protein, partial [Thermoleophilaceae bacterium]|nr:YvcK family protein [Thermoleophilaceae bacterium]